MLRTAVVLLLVTALVGCTKDAAREPMGDQMTIAAPMAMRMPGVGRDEASPAASRIALYRSRTRSVSHLPTIARAIARSAQVRIVVADPVATARQIGAQIEAMGGYISDSRQWRADEQILAGETLRVPASRLSDALATIRRTAIRVDNESVTAQDVTEETSDLGAQLTNLRATELELRGLLGTVRQRTQKAADILEVFNQLSSVREDIDRTQARLNVLGELTDLSTISLDLVPDALSQPIAAAGWRPGVQVRDASRTLVSTLKWLFGAAVWVVIYVLPVILVLGIPLALAWQGVRNVRARLMSNGGSAAS